MLQSARLVFLLPAVLLLSSWQPHGADAQAPSKQGNIRDSQAQTPASQAKSQSAGSSAAQQQSARNYGMAKACVPPTLVETQPRAPSTPPLPQGSQPNFIIVLTDDQGWDDIGLHQPQKPGGKPTWVETPNLDKFIKQSTQFDNFYTAPMCAQSRAMILTGRDFPRTGTMLINGGYDYINRNEVTSAEFFAAAGYKTAHFGKWHNGRTLGYEPWESGFQESWQPTAHVHLDNLMRHNGRYVQTRGLMEQDLMDKILGYLKNQEGSEQPFYVYYAPHAIHQGFMRPGQGPRWQRPAPEPYKSKYRNMKPALPSDTAQVWAMLDYMDDVLGRLFDFINNSPLKENTYVMITSDNGAELFPTERKGYDKLRRMPSGMQGFKTDVEEGGVRNYLAIQGPGVQAGITDSTLTSINDILPTMADLAGLSAARHLPWDGIALTNNLLIGEQPSTMWRGTSASTKQQKERYVWSFAPDCWSPDSVPELGPDRQVLKPQPLLDYDTGGVDGKGFKRCIGVRHADYKWLGRTGKVYRFHGQSHIELPCNEVTDSEGRLIAEQLSSYARQYFQSLVADTHSFNKPTFYLGLNKWVVTNILPDGAHERTPGRVELLPNGATGFSRTKDSMCFAVDVIQAGSYKVAIMYTSHVQATFKLSVGLHSKIKEGSAPSVSTRLPIARGMKTKEMGSLDLTTSDGRRTEVCLEMVATSSPGQPVFDNLANIRFTLAGKGKKAWAGWVDKQGTATEQAKADSLHKVQGTASTPGSQTPQHKAADGKPGAGSAVTSATGSSPHLVLQSKEGSAQGQSGATGKSSLMASPSEANDDERVSSAEYESDFDPYSPLTTYLVMQQQGLHSNLNATEGMKAAERDAVTTATSSLRVSKAKESLAVGAQAQSADDIAWQLLRQLYGWPDGQQGHFESLFSPYESEGIYTCSKCQPSL